MFFFTLNACKPGNLGNGKSRLFSELNAIPVVQRVLIMVVAASFPFVMIALALAMGLK